MEKKFEDCMEELSSVVSQLQKEETPLEEMLVQYKKGTEAAMACLTILKETERDIPVSYTHLDVYKRQSLKNIRGFRS